MTIIGTAYISGTLANANGAVVTLEAVYSGDATGVSVAWTGPMGTTAPVQVTTPKISWTFAAATDGGAYAVTLSDPAATDSPITVKAVLSVVRTINRFGRNYQSYDPDGAGGGPSTWILAGPGGAAAGAGPGAGVGPGGAYENSSTATVGPILVPIVAGQVLTMHTDGTVLPADCQSYATSIVCGVAITSVVSGKLVNYVNDGVVRLDDWTAIAGDSALLSGARYFLGPGGRLVLTPPEKGYAAPVGRALGPKELEVEIGSVPIKVG